MKDENIKKIYEEFIDKYKIYFQSNEEIWINKLKQVEEYIILNKKRPSHGDKNNDIKCLGSWLSHQLNNYDKNKQIMKDNNILILWEEFIDKYKIYFLSNEEKWFNNLKEVELFINQYKQRPSTEDKKENVKKLGNWLSDQLKKYKKKIEIMKDEKIKKIWEEFIDKYKIYFQSNEELWLYNINQVQIYIDDNNKRPSHSDKNISIKKLAIWLTHSLKNYDKNEQIMKNNEIRKIWEEFIDKYKIYFQSNEEIWLDNLKEVEEYIIQNNKRPNSNDKNNNTKKLGAWLITQSQNYKKNDHSMKDKNIKKLWEEFTIKYKIFLQSSEEIWLNNLKQVEEYIIHNNKRPSASNIDIKIKQLGMFINMQQINYKKNEHCMKDENIKKLWEEFVDKYSKYFNNIV